MGRSSLNSLPKWDSFISGLERKRPTPTGLDSINAEKNNPRIPKGVDEINDMLQRRGVGVQLDHDSREVKSILKRGPRKEGTQGVLENLLDPRPPKVIGMPPLPRGKGGKPVAPSVEDFYGKKK
jgi:hypothetical protein